MTNEPKDSTAKGSRSSFAEVSYGDWLRRVDGQLGPHHRVEGIELEPLCTANHPERLVRPGTTPRHADKQIPWIACQAFADPDPKKLNQYLKSDLANGVAGVRLRLDRGAGLSTVTAFDQAFRETEGLWRVLMLDAGDQFSSASAVLLDWLRDSAVDVADRVLLLGADPLRALAEKGSLCSSISDLDAEGAALVRRSMAELPGSRALAVSTEPYREAGADIDQELAIAMAVAAHYLRAMERHGLEPEQVAAELTFVTSTGQQIFLEIAKLRALRILWQGLLEACGVEAPPPPWIHSAILQRSLPATDPANNLLRITTAGMAAVVGGADSLETTWQDTAGLGDASDGNRRLARNTQHILELEAHFGKVRDPGDGSYLIETLTQEFVAGGWAIFREIENRGGALEALSSGWLQVQVADRWQERRRLIEQGQVQLLGVNAYADPERPVRSPATATHAPGNVESDRSPIAVQPLVPHRDSEPFEPKPEQS